MKRKAPDPGSVEHEAQLLQTTRDKYMQRLQKQEYWLRVDIDRSARVSRCFYVGQRMPQVYEEWVKIMNGHLDKNDVTALEAHAAEQPRHDCYMRKFLKVEDKTRLKRKDMAGARCVYEGYKETRDGNKIILWVDTSS